MLALSRTIRAAAVAIALAVPPARCAEPALSLSISGPKDAVKTGSEVVLKLTLTNTADHEINLLSTWTTDKNSWAEVHFRATVKDGRGNSVAYTKHGKEVWGSGTVGYDGSDSMVQMPAGKQATCDLVLSRLFDLTKPGVYVVQVTRRNAEDARYPQTESNTITVTVTD